MCRTCMVYSLSPNDAFVIIGSGDGVAHVRRQANIATKADFSFHGLN